MVADYLLKPILIAVYFFVPHSMDTPLNAIQGIINGIVHAVSSYLLGAVWYIIFRLIVVRFLKGIPYLGERIVIRISFLDMWIRLHERQIWKKGNTRDKAYFYEFRCNMLS